MKKPTLSDFKIGDAVMVKDGRLGQPKEHEAYVKEVPGRVSGTVLVHMNFGGDGMYLDYPPEWLRPIKLQDLSPCMMKGARELRWKNYGKKDLKEAP